MLDCYYTTAIINIMKVLGLSSTQFLHLGRGITPSALELEEVVGLDKRAIGNWDIDTYVDIMTQKYSWGLCEISQDMIQEEIISIIHTV